MASPDTDEPHGNGSFMHDGPPPMTDQNTFDMQTPTQAQPTQDGQHDEETAKKVIEILNSDIGVNLLLGRTKSAIEISKQFVAFLKKRASLEEEKAVGLNKLVQASSHSLHREDMRTGSFAKGFSDLLGIHESMTRETMQFAMSVGQMHEDLNKSTLEWDQRRKLKKAEALAAEKKFADALGLANKAKAKYYSLAEDYDRVRTGDKSAGRVFGIKGPKSAGQHEEDLKRKVQSAESDYETRTKGAESSRQELIKYTRPQVVSELRKIIQECEAALTLQAQKLATFTEKVKLAEGKSILPVDANKPGLRGVVKQVDTESEFNSFVLGQASKATTTGEIKYEQHPTLAPKQTMPAAASVSSATQPQGLNTQPSLVSSPQQNYQSQPPPAMSSQGYNPQPSYNQSYSQQSPQAAPPYGGATQPYQSYGGYQPANGPPQAAAAPRTSGQAGQIFGISLHDLFQRDGALVPIIIPKCISAIDTFGLSVDGIYRQNGSKENIDHLKNLFDNDSMSVDLRTPAHFNHDIHAVTGLLKRFLMELPEPLVTFRLYDQFIDAGRIDDDIVRRDSIHRLINELPDEHYAAMRDLVFHWYRVASRSSENRMSISNLAISLAPTFMGAHRGSISDAGIQCRVLNTIIEHTYDIFEEPE